MWQMFAEKSLEATFCKWPQQPNQQPSANLLDSDNQTRRLSEEAPLFLSEPVITDVFWFLFFFHFVDFPGI